jgi:hypothetical protein
MCFDPDYDWTASVVETTDPIAVRCKPTLGTLAIGVYQRLSWRDDGESIEDY